MCGILGFVRAKSTTVAQDSDLAGIFTDGMLTGALRGIDSFGYMTCNDNNYRAVKKYPVAATMLYGSPVFGEMLARAKTSQIVVGHHRAKTTGVISETAAHPYVVASSDNKRVVWGVHNGSLLNWASFKDGKNYITDSEYLFSMIAEKGPTALKDIDGAYAVAFMMSDHPGKLFLARNKERPLAYAFANHGKAMMFASEYGMLDWLASRSPYTTALDQKLVAGGGAWADIVPHNLYTIDIADPTNFTKEEVLAPPQKTYKASSSYTSYHREESFTEYNTNSELERYKVKYHPRCTEAEIKEAIDFEMIDDEVVGKVTKVKFDGKGNVKFAEGVITEDGERGIIGLRFIYRDPEAVFATVLASANVDTTMGLRFKVGGVLSSKSGKGIYGMSIVVGEIKYVFCFGQDKSEDEPKKLVLAN